MDAVAGAGRSSLRDEASRSSGGSSMRPAEPLHPPRVKLRTFAAGDSLLLAASSFNKMYVYLERLDDFQNFL